jgi:hypothetical protein
MVRSTTMAEDQACGSCGRDVEVCFFCERQDCDDAQCYRCVVVALGEFVPQPHDHGG